MKLGRLKIKVHFYRKNLKVRGTKLWEIIPSNTKQPKGCIVSLYFTHIFIDWDKPQWQIKLMMCRDMLVYLTEVSQSKAEDKNASPCGQHYDRGHADGLIRARAELEDMFKLWD